MKRILFKTGHTGLGGVERTQVEYINYLHSINANFKVVLDKNFAEQNAMHDMFLCPVTYFKNETATAEFENAKQNKNNSFLHKIKYNFAISKYRKTLRTEFAEIVNDFKPEIAINYHTGYYFDLDTLKKCKNIVWIHTAIINPKRPINKALKYIKTLHKYDLIVCVSKGIVEEIIELAPELKNKTTYLYNPINFERIKKLSNDNLIDNEINEKFLLMVARLDLGKGFDTLFKAFDIAKDNGYDGKLYVVGDGKINDTIIINELLNQSKYKEEIKLLGGKINPFNWMKHCDKFILTSIFEGLGIVLIEALAVKDIVISSNCKTGPNEILDNGKYGYLFEVGDYNELARLMIEAKPKDRTEIDKHLEQFSPEVVLPKFNNILNGM